MSPSTLHMDYSSLEPQGLASSQQDLLALPLSLSFQKQLPKHDKYMDKQRREISEFHINKKRQAEGGTQQEASSATNSQQQLLWERKSWTVAKSPLTQLFMTGFMLYMSGTSIQIFPIIMLIMSFIQPLRAILSASQTFKIFEEKQINVVWQKILFILLQSVGMTMVMIKCYYMKLLPTTVDWMHTEYVPMAEVVWGFKASPQ